MERHALQWLLEWKSRTNRKPLVVRGARQVGKTKLVRMFAEKQFDNLVEINFDETPEKKVLFQQADVRKILRLIEADLEVKIIEGKTLLFLDEIQAAPEVFSKLRYFYEKSPDLHIITAGSLLDFTLADHDFSMPVGRIEYLFLGPMNFEEFLEASGRTQLAAYAAEYQLSDDIPQSIHLQLQQYVKEYFALGGMPGVLDVFIKSNFDYLAASLEQQSLVQTWYDDFTKYCGRTDIQLLKKIFKRIPAQIGSAVKYVNLERDVKAAQVRNCLELLEKARLIYRIRRTAGNGLPLEAEMDEHRFKLLFLDIGLMNSMLGLKASDFLYFSDLVSAYSGALAEQFIGQQLLYASRPIDEPSLFFWTRGKKGTSSEIDYLISGGRHLVPVEVKAGKTGRLKSLHVFVSEKELSTALRFYSEPPEIRETASSIPGKKKQMFRLVSLPLYLAGQTQRILESLG